MKNDEIIFDQTMFWIGIFAIVVLIIVIFITFGLKQGCINPNMFTQEFVNKYSGDWCPYKIK